MKEKLFLVISTLLMVMAIVVIASGISSSSPVPDMTSADCQAIRNQSEQGDLKLTIHFEDANKIIRGENIRLLVSVENVSPYRQSFLSSWVVQPEGFPLISMQSGELIPDNKYSRLKVFVLSINCDSFIGGYSKIIMDEQQYKEEVTDLAPGEKFAGIASTGVAFWKNSDNIVKVVYEDGKELPYERENEYVVYAVYENLYYLPGNEFAWRGQIVSNMLAFQVK